jgi:hypothetical protein
MPHRRYEWYEVVNGASLQQGDFFYKCPVVVPVANPIERNVDVKVIESDVVIMSQSCDLERGKVEIVLVCPFIALSEARKHNSQHFSSAKWLKGVRQGKEPGYHLLNEITLQGHEQEPVIVDFRNVYGVPFEYFQTLLEDSVPRIRLLPPYKEHLSQAFARFFMRVGLPVPVNI